MRAKLGGVSAQIYDLLGKHPDGLTIVDIRKMLGVGEDQEHLDRRIRDLRRYFLVPGTHVGNKYVYKLVGRKTVSAADSGSISGKLRAEILHVAKGRCQMCGGTVAEDQVRLQIDHKIPQSWGGATIAENLWAICEQCNNGKRDYFASFNELEMERIMTLESVHERIAELLRLHQGQPVSSRLIEFVANATERQDDWQKRLRELRYEPIGLDIRVGKRKTPEGYIESTYTLHNWRDLPSDHRKLIREWESRGQA